MRGLIESDYLLNISLLTDEDISIQEVLHKFLQLTCKLANWPLAHFYWIDASGKVTPSDIWVGTRPPEFQHMEGTGLSAATLEAGQTLWSSDPAVLPPISTISSAIAVPIYINLLPVVVAEFFSTENEATDQKLIDVVSAAARQISQKLERKSAERELSANFQKLKETQTHLIHSEKMASVGVIAAGVAHEINNPLSYVYSNTEYILGKMEQLDLPKNTKSELIEIQKETLEGIERVKEIVQNLKTFARLDGNELRSTTVNDVLNNTLKILHNELKYRCDVELQLKSQKLIPCYTGQLSQVLINLLMNAADAVENRRGKLQVITQDVDDGVQITIADNGKGMSPETVAKLFTPFFTTKPVGKGTGLGLFVSYGVIQNHQGKIEVESKLGEGTQFKVFLPSERKAA